MQLMEIDPGTRPARLRELNPSNRVPVLELDGTGIWESTAICEWLEEAHPEPPLWPSDLADRAAARALLRWLDDELTANFFLSLRKEAMGFEPGDSPDVVQVLRQRLVNQWQVLEWLLARTDGPWLLAGAAPTLADLAAIPLAVRLPQWKPELAPDEAAAPGSSAWLQALRDRPSAAEVDRKGEPVGD